MKLTMFGTGYVGLVSGVCFADIGNDVLCADVDSKKIALLERGANPIFEPGLDALLKRNKETGRLSFTDNVNEAVNKCDMLFICVGTPSNKEGSVDTQYVEAVAKTIGQNLKHEAIIINKSTVPVGTAEKVRKIIETELKKRDKKFTFHVVSNPEFLKEGAAVNDFFNPDRIIVGIEKNDEYARTNMEKLYRGIVRTNRPLLFTDTKSAELIKYASNAMLATRISFINQLSQYCERVGADIIAVSKGMGLDTRIGPRFLYPGIGYGGSCFPKDVLGLINSIKETGLDAKIFEAVHEANEAQKRSLFPKIKDALGDLKGKKVALWGLSFKPKTDDIREAPSKAIVKWLFEQGVEVVAFDPEAMENFKKEFPNIKCGADQYSILKNADLLILVTEWDSFRNPDWKRIKELMKTHNLIDGRNIWTQYDSDIKEFGFRFWGVGR